MENIIGTFEAKTHFTKLITQVMAGEEILITRRGKSVAKIIPIAKQSNEGAIKAAILRLRNLSKEMQLGKFNWEEWKCYRDDGRQ